MRNLVINCLISKFVKLLKKLNECTLICHWLVLGIINRFIRFDFPVVSFEELLLDDNCIRALGELDNLFSVDSHSIDVEFSELYDMRSSWFIVMPTFSCEESSSESFVSLPYLSVFLSFAFPKKLCASSSSLESSVWIWIS